MVTIHHALRFVFFTVPWRDACGAGFTLRFFHCVVGLRELACCFTCRCKITSAESFSQIAVEEAASVNAFCSC